MSNLLDKIKNRLHYYRHLKPSRLKSVFIVSTGRTGTNFFESFFNQLNNNIHAVHEPQPDFFELSMNKIRDNWNDKKIEEYIKESREKYLIQLSKHRVKYYIESNPFLPLLLPNLKRVFKKAKFIIITRDAKSYMKSALNKSPLDDGKFFMYDDNDKRERLSAKDYSSDKYHYEWDNFNRKEKIAWYWNKTNLILLDFFKQKKSICLQIKFEDFFLSNKETQQEICINILNFLNIKYNDHTLKRLLKELNIKKNSTKEIVFDGFEKWSSEEQNIFLEITKEATQQINDL